MAVGCRRAPAPAGPDPSGGWQVRVQDLDGDPADHVRIASGWSVATSSTQKRRWEQDGHARHAYDLLSPPKHALRTRLAAAQQRSPCTCHLYAQNHTPRASSFSPDALSHAPRPSRERATITFATQAIHV